ncbi:hypothetical protein KR51_00023610 [Rubidibacter lacunae KORDI 51-2]|uniref:Uncharacterized protein n=1 Tax=Rubidibacter lacunae KORDI 51-2 TaxID=582515 RepID=U5DKM7_9CHRO|nr:hypothetical protein KR51_00023610 [Rubidibacter lacunae KORDI 51-2]
MKAASEFHAVDSSTQLARQYPARWCVLLCGIIRRTQGLATRTNAVSIATSLPGLHLECFQEIGHSARTLGTIFGTLEAN